MNFLAQLWQTLSQRVAPIGDLPLERRSAGGRAPAPAAGLREQVAVALAELHAAEHYFQTVSDPELVDHAIYQLEAAKRKYTYLLKLVQRQSGDGQQGGSSRGLG